MQLGFLTHYSEEDVKLAREIGFKGLEFFLGAWDLEKFAAGDGAAVDAVKRSADTMKEHGLVTTAVAYYQNSLEGDAKKKLDEFKAVFKLAEIMGTDVVATHAGRDADKSIADSMPKFAAVFTELCKAAEDAGKKLAVENWPGLGGYPVTHVNLAYSPQAWEMMFDAVPSMALGLEYDPSHLVWLDIDYIEPIFQFGERIYHVHAKDTEILYDKRSHVSNQGEGWYRYRVPGWGEIDWPMFLSALAEVGYDAGIVIEHEDPIFEGDRRTEGLKLGYNFLTTYIIT